LTGQYVNYNNRNSSLAINSIFTLKADSKDRIWIGTNGAVFLYDMSTGTFKSDVFPEHIEPFTKSIRYIYEDNHKNLWFCDDKEGVVKVDEHFTKFEHLTVDDFLPNNSVMSIIEDPHDGGLWFSTQRGLLYIKESSQDFLSL
jgi:ligand-binding sensor domain-containing protein